MSSRELHGQPLKTVENPRRPNNALQDGILTYLKSYSDSVPDLSFLPKKHTSYPPLLILPVNFSSATPEWKVRYESLSAKDRQDLFAVIATAFKPHVITHIAINAAIGPRNTADDSENFMRSPSGLKPVYGDFGPSSLFHQGENGSQPTRKDLEAAFWVSTMQNRGIIQIWAPRWTMFSRGNITEKVRILGDGNGMEGLIREALNEDLKNVDVADFYVGIGYFAFSYLKRGVRVVFGWEINGWSVEGLRRGCERNGWNCVVVRLDENGAAEEGGLERIIHFLNICTEAGTCIVFWGNNQSAPKLLEDIRERTEQKGLSTLNLRHVNLGLLPTARDSWRNAVQILHAKKGGWIHVHENVDVQQIELKRDEIITEFTRLLNTTQEGHWQVSCCHTEQVKTYAPGVMHCVFDIEIKPKNLT